MISNNIDVSLCVGDIELVSIPYEKLNDLDFPNQLEAITLISINFEDYSSNDNITIEFRFENFKMPYVIIDGGDICYKRLFEFLRETDKTETVLCVVFENFQLSYSCMLKLSGGYARQDPSKPILQNYKNGLLYIYEFMRIDNYYTFTDYTKFPQWRKPRILYFNEDGSIQESFSSISFMKKNINYLDYESFHIDDYLEILYKLTGKYVELDYSVFEFKFKDETLTELDEIMINLYFFFDDYKNNKNLMVSSRDELFTLSFDEKTLIHMQFI